MDSKLEASQKVIDSLTTGSFDAVIASFDETLAKALPAATLAQQWAQIQEQAGPFKSVTEAKTGKAEGLDVVMYMLEFERARLICRLVYNGDRVVGMHFAPAA